MPVLLLLSQFHPLIIPLLNWIVAILLLFNAATFSTGTRNNVVCGHATTARAIGFIEECHGDLFCGDGGDDTVSAG